MTLDMQPSTLPFPLFIQVGFAGARRLYDREQHPKVDEETFLDQLGQQLAAHIVALHGHLSKPGRRTRLVGVSQMAIGGDMAFSRACRLQAVPQRVLLPQPRDEFLSARGHNETPDFTEMEHERAVGLLDADHVIEERVVSESANRHERLRETSIEILEQSDVVICLFSTTDADKDGGTREFLRQANSRNKPALELLVQVVDGDPVLTVVNWHNKQHLNAPVLPRLMADLQVPLVEGAAAEEAAIQAVKTAASSWSKRHSQGFKWGAILIIVTHILATTCAALAMRSASNVFVALLYVELIFLSMGLAAHLWLHRSEKHAAWAKGRLLAEIARSVLAVNAIPIALDYLFVVQLPIEWLPLVKSIDVLHLIHARRQSRQTVMEMSHTYCDKRLSGSGAQLEYYKRRESTAIVWHRIAKWTFYVASVSAMAATTLKVIDEWDASYLRFLGGDPMTQAGWLGVSAILFPLVAVAALSLAAAFDLEGRRHTFREMHLLLVEQRARLKVVATLREFNILIQETERALLGETIAWYWRRVFSSVH